MEKGFVLFYKTTQRVQPSKASFTTWQLATLIFSPPPHTLPPFRLHNSPYPISLSCELPLDLALLNDIICLNSALCQEPQTFSPDLGDELCFLFYAAYIVMKNFVLFLLVNKSQNLPWPIPVAPLYKGWVFGRSIAGISGSNPGGGIDFCLLWVLCGVR